MAFNIVDQFKKNCTVVLREGVRLHGIPDPVVVMAGIEIQMFDMIGILVDVNDTVLFIPWGNVICIDTLPEPTEGWSIDSMLEKDLEKGRGEK